MTADEVKKRFGLVPHPREGGWYARTYESGEAVSPGCFADGRYASARLTGTAIYYLLEPHSFSEMHRLRSDEVFHFYAGDTVEMLQLAPGEAGRRVLLGNDLGEGSDPQVVGAARSVAGVAAAAGRALGSAGLHGEPGV